ncbi:hypothetical protein J2Z44_002080 [Clostridium punense]|uniref:Uncharacterized protein n=1 Tax=Clostridium punense TaxID=1054297 RepID=A0ABS4K6M8_9CLOT|nr:MULTISPECIES: DUF5685 family protein [Clostridium]EQB88667.1 hypothetical protein M918_03640 [Clostridium sp. BL8]MBP2022279.1 hypothetical protein [Clostridium punense]
MFGYVMPCKMELKIRDYEKFKAYYCGLCLSLKNNFGNVSRFALNYDMTFLGVLLDSLDKNKNSYINSGCIAHPIGKRLKIVDNKAIDYAAFCNTSLMYFKLLDDYEDNNSLHSKLLSLTIKKFVKTSDINLKPLIDYMENKLNELYTLEKSLESFSIDEISDKFADLTGFIISYYYKEEEFKDDLYNLGYSLGRWIYIIDAYDDLEEDMRKKKFNAINKAFNEGNLPYEEFVSLIRERVELNLILSADSCLRALDNLPLAKNEELLYNILQLGLMEKMERIKIRSEEKNEKSL